MHASWYVLSCAIRLVHDRRVFHRDILPGTVPRGADRLREGRDDRCGRLRPRRLGVSEARPGPIVRDEKVEKTTNRRHAATRARVQRKDHTGIVHQPVYRKVSRHGTTAAVRGTACSDIRRCLRVSITIQVRTGPHD